MANILTAVSWFCVVASIAACAADKTGTSLAGSTACDGMDCGAGMVCMIQPFGFPTDAGPTASCVALPAGCIVFDCSGSACPPCLAEQCAYYPDIPSVSLTGRTLSCPAA